jgi:hypothetical protein
MGLDATDTPANAAAFGVTVGGSPQLRLLALTECGTRALIDAVFDGAGNASEHVLARRLLASLAPGMLLLADRNFPAINCVAWPPRPAPTWPGGSRRTWCSGP